MTEALNRPNVAKVLSSLKDFQRDTVDYIFHRMYLDSDPTRRFLVADEVGLGKTLVARGLVAKVVDHLWERVPRIDIVYICSNADIARQNINRLNVTEQDAFVLPSRITLLPTTVRDLERNKLNLISLTPGTSFNLKSSLGRADERALLYWLLDRAWSIRGRSGPLNVLEGTSNTGNFRQLVRAVREETNIDDALADDFARTLQFRMQEDRTAGRSDMRSRFDDLSDRFRYARYRGNRLPEDLDEQRALVGELRALLASTCLRALQPDLIILDEFQRFKYLLEGEDDPAILARELFDYADDVSKARVVLLSATPYKMYTLSDETAEDHYEDFIRTLRFLLPNDRDTEQLRALIAEFRRELYRLGEGGEEALPRLKSEIERQLRQVIVRTERLSVTADRNGMLAEVPAEPILHDADVTVYLQLQKIARFLDQPDTLEYWKSAPYLLNFMDEYELKGSFEEAVEDPKTRTAITRLLAQIPELCLPWDSIRQYSEIDPGNAKLRRLLEDTVSAGAWKLLWMPPSLPYYSPGGPFAEPQLARLTKRLIFSCWKVVPKVVAALTSYQAERLMIRSLEPDAENTPEARKRRSGLLRFAQDTDGRLTGMPVLGLLYPSFALARLGDPLEIGRKGLEQGLPTQDALVELVKRRIEELLPRVGADPRAGPVDESWYWAAPILLDLDADTFATRKWLEDPDLPSYWAGVDDPEEEVSAWDAHVEAARRLLRGPHLLGPPPEDLALVLAQMAIAAPGVCLLRAFSRLFGHSALTQQEPRSAAAMGAWSFRTLFNSAEATALIRGLNPAEPYWRRLLEYSLDGGLQSVLDEFVHVLWEIHGLFGKSVEDAIDELSYSIETALTLRTPSLVVDDIRIDRERHRIRQDRHRMRAKFALRFGDDSDEETGEVTRSDEVRAAFNSPFWPFVLATTSVGQEGLDFHLYCHAVVHWNLPANPVDLEQREGRIHRYKGHAVRKNLARRYGIPKVDGVTDPWRILFDLGQKDRPSGSSDIIPFWVFQVENGARIERHVPALPLSRDRERLSVLRASLAVYRMVFGQPRQEELIAYLLERVGLEKSASMLEELRIDLRPNS